MAKLALSKANVTADDGKVWEGVGVLVHGTLLRLTKDGRTVHEGTAGQVYRTGTRGWLVNMEDGTHLDVAGVRAACCGR